MPTCPFIEATRRRAPVDATNSLVHVFLRASLVTLANLVCEPETVSFFLPVSPIREKHVPADHHPCPFRFALLSFVPSLSLSLDSIFLMTRRRAPLLRQQQAQAHRRPCLGQDSGFGCGLRDRGATAVRPGRRPCPAAAAQTRSRRRWSGRAAWSGGSRRWRRGLLGGSCTR